MGIGLCGALLTGCDPLAADVRAESVWYDTHRIATEAGVTLVQIPDGDPVGYWPRLVVRDDGIDLDDRAWILSLPTEFFSTSPIPKPSTWPGLVSLNAGRLPPDQDRLLIRPLYDAIMEMQGRHRSIVAGDFEARVQGRVTVIPEPSIPLETLRAVLYTSAQAQLATWAIVGQVGSNLRHPGAPDLARDCPYAVQATLTATTAWLDLQDQGILAPMLTGAGGCADMDGIVQAAQALAVSCSERWAAQMASQGHPRDEQTQCISVTLQLEPSLTAEFLLQRQAELYQAWPHLNQSTLSIDPSSTDASACTQAVAVNTLTPAQLDYLCDAESVARVLQAGPDRWRAMMLPEDHAHDLDALARVFPEYAAEYRTGEAP